MTTEQMIAHYDLGPDQAAQLRRHPDLEELKAAAAEERELYVLNRLVNCGILPHDAARRFLGV